ncbi:hypothetical protein C8R43DRAFT_1120938 [Mycena crocata]|nr:hypothetical protein C8R43DRAFT_1135628 [Mycena crocata]KAJ7169041.1 hypothetical protein C8R43DRAFT_1120938 [Mycena crocata]
MPPRKRKHEVDNWPRVTRASNENAKKRSKTSALYYAAHPELREKNRLHAAEKRSAQRARRRQWDAPKKPRTPLNMHSLLRLGSLKSTVLLTDAEGEGTVDDVPQQPTAVPVENDNTSALCVTRGTEQSLTSAERVAAAALAGMANAESAQEPVNDKLTDPDPEAESVVNLENTVGAASLLTLHSAASCAVGVVSEYPWIMREEGPDLRPLTQTQTIQMHVAKLNSGPLTAPTAEEALLWDDIIIDVPPWLKTMGAKHWLEVQSWAENIDEIGPHGMCRERGAERLVQETRRLLEISSQEVGDR